MALHVMFKKWPCHCADFRGVIHACGCRAASPRVSEGRVPNRGCRKRWEEGLHRLPNVWL